jgi:hypothetical protein
VKEAHAFAGHRILVAAGEVEHAVRYSGKVGGLGHEAVIAVDHHPRTFWPSESG